MLIFPISLSLSAEKTTLYSALCGFTENDPCYLGYIKFSELVKEKTLGRICITSIENSRWNHQQLAEMAATGKLDLCLVHQNTLEKYNPNIGILSLPFIFDSWEHVWSVLDGEIGKKLFYPLQKDGLKVIGVFNNDVCNIISSVQIKNPEDINGLKFLLRPSDTFWETAQILGAQTVPADNLAIPNFLQAGKIDAAVLPTADIKNLIKHGAANTTYICENEIYFRVMPLLINLKRFNSVSQNDQKIILEAAYEATSWQREKAIDAELSNTRFLKNNNVHYYRPNRRIWKAAIIPVYDKHPEWKDIINNSAITQLKK